MNNERVAEQIAEDMEIFGSTRRAAPVFEIRRLMIEKGIRNSDVAARLRVSEANVSRMLRGDQNLKIDTLYLLASAVEEKLNFSFSDEVRPVRVTGKVKKTCGEDTFDNDYAVFSLNHELFLEIAGDLEERSNEAVFALG
ncbi:helix-turn-helix transcriptional regulator [Pseudomonas sp. R3-52-08]|uniref:helix-turn-helix domain-containing protein n=1 Tax=Pseudomonas sp. R3-52-08 TaxID=1173284 RepID=UPI000F70E64C|nr:helix-turn-helix transcriptional regulator [Pseudomonas sp. R3-52-08]AZF22264.1 hypothetical protein C4J91_3521 [Pseudomonas sp. R3-52-08]